MRCLKKIWKRKSEILLLKDCVFFFIMDDTEVLENLCKYPDLLNQQTWSIERFEAERLFICLCGVFFKLI
uniref:Uncharacterized protein n=1 Tax=Octopus bimaculoides TaxID=37653 RepID=A0A0L8FKD6_OCTBM